MTSKLTTNHSWHHYSGWAGTLSRFFSVQIFVQFLLFVSGILILRVCNKREYALYTIAITVQVMIKTLSDLGIGDALMTTAGRVWNDPVQTGRLVNATLRLRRWFLLASLLITTPFAFYLLLKAGASLRYAVLIWFILAISQSSALQLTVVGVIPRLHGHVCRLQNLDLFTAVLRLVLLLAASLLVLNTFVVVFIATVIQMVQAAFVTRWARAACDLNAQPDGTQQKELLPLVFRQVPNAIFACLQGQITICLITLLGTTDKIADLGALSRLGAMFAILGPFVANIVQPKFARLQDRHRLKQRYLQICGGFLLGGIVVVSIAGYFPGLFVFILGKAYATTTDNILYMMAAVTLGQFYSIIWGLNAVKGWIRRLWITIPITLVSQICLIPVLDLGSVRGVILFGALPLLPTIGYLVFLSCQGFKNSDAMDQSRKAAGISA